MAPRKGKDETAQGTEDQPVAAQVEQGEAVDTAVPAKAEKAKAKAEPEAPAKSEQELYDDAIAELLSQLDEKERKHLGAELFVEACLAFGINPNPSVRPVEILHGDGGRRWRFIAGSEVDGVPDRVVFVTAGGVKLSHPMDQEAEDRMLSIFGLKGIDAKGQQIIQPLPNDLTLPRPFVTGVPPRQPERPKVPVLRDLAQQRVRGRR